MTSGPSSIRVLVVDDSPAMQQLMRIVIEAEPELALAGGIDGMDFVRQLFHDAPSRMSAEAVLVLEIGHEADHFIAAFPALEVAWLNTSAGDDQVLLVTRDALLTLPR